MKKIILISFITIFTISIATAQNKPTKGTSGLGINYYLSSPVSLPAFKYDYYLTDSWVLTAFYKPSFINRRLKNTGDNFFNVNSSSRYSQSISFGIEKHFFDKLKIDPFVGLSVIHGFSSRNKITTEKQSESSNGSTYYEKTVNTSPITNSLSAAFNLGMNYFILNNFSVGLQFNLGNSFGFVNGNSKTYSLERITDNQANVIREEENKGETKMKNTSSNLFYSVALKAAFYFPTKKSEK